MGNKNLIHLKFDYSEALEGKKDILFVEQRLVETLGRIENYNELREKEMLMKKKLHRKIRESLTELKKLNKIIPKIEMPKVKKEKETIKTKTADKEKAEKSKNIKKESSSIEDQIRDIQEKLKALQG